MPVSGVMDSNYLYLGMNFSKSQKMRPFLNHERLMTQSGFDAAFHRWIIMKKGILVIVLLCISMLALSQQEKNENLRLAGSVTLTTKGLSTFPNLTLGKPAAIFDFSVGGDKFRFDPTLRFGLDGKPWTFIFWLRYQAIQTEKFGLRVGAHPAYSFRTIEMVQIGKNIDILRATTFLAGEIAPVFRVAKNVTLGPYIILTHGVDDDAVQYSNFISLVSNITDINLGGKLYSNLMGQAYYLRMDDRNGYYINGTLSVNMRNFPLSVSSTVNRAIESTIPGEKLLWNLNLIYRFGGIYRKLVQ